MTTIIGKLPDGSKGFDANVRVTKKDAALFWDAGYRFCVRYVRRDQASVHDLSVSELVGLLSAGLGVMVVQHVHPEGWHPLGLIGKSYGAIAAETARQVGIPPSVTVWCDLEGIANHTPASDVIAFCNAWYDSVVAAGFDPGLYVGFGCGLTSQQLYRNLKFKRFWSAYNLNKDNYPAVRGVQMRQGPYPAPAHRVKGIAFEYDTDTISVDAMGDSPLLLLPRDPG